VAPPALRRNNTPHPSPGPPAPARNAHWLAATPVRAATHRWPRSSARLRRCIRPGTQSSNTPNPRPPPRPLPRPQPAGHPPTKQPTQTLPELPADRHAHHREALPSNRTCPAQTSGRMRNPPAHALTTPVIRADQAGQKETIPMTISRAPNRLRLLRPSRSHAPNHTESPARRILPSPAPGRRSAIPEFVSWIR